MIVIKCDNCEKEMDHATELTRPFDQKVTDMDISALRVIIQPLRPSKEPLVRFEDADLCRDCFKLAVESAIEWAEKRLWNPKESQNA